MLKPAARLLLLFVLVAVVAYAVIALLSGPGFERAASGPVTGSPGIISHQQSPAVSPYTLFTEPGSGRDPILDAIGTANRSINLTIYTINDKEILSALKNASARGVAVRVIYDGGKDPGSEVTDRNLPRMQELEKSGVLTRPGPPVFPKTHQKTMTIDGSYSLVMTCNLKPDTFTTTRDFIVRTDDPGQVLEIEEVFDADWNNRTATYHEPALVWSPDHAKETIISLIAGAQSDIVIYNENLEDPQVVENLSRAAGRGVSVRVLIPSPLDEKKRLKAAEKLTKNGVAVRQGTDYYIHAKVLIADSAGNLSRGFAGSQNFEAQHLDEDRELGILLEDPVILSRIRATFEEDWERRSKPVPVSAS
jgi:phosphatidylserine/phosphatidylglycerophosphate/cardiolipin synthase-like enzyme